ncbi:hypothetical protein DZC52_05110 [Wenzhouxiangella sediminis]|uniref:Tetratricopeptide repeat protein n=2 Tax=Wenzhouxiangella sediminis TaxID=1792836 RepID=A0A3E1KA67_9GAMM|nr:hypothetical protein DZC52_05110 [Wenzhouxiangella sediminis]
MIVEAGVEADCEKLFQQHLETDLSLSYQEFDQTMGSGFRALAQAGCERRAADLIEAYIEATGAEQSSLRWHIAQLRASHGDNAEAIRYARASLRENEDLSEHPLRWNDYVLATIAFLEKNREALIDHRERVAEGVDEHRGNAMNLRLLDAMIEHFGASYSDAMQSLANE